MRNAMGLMAGPERPAVTLAILGRRVSASIAMARNVFTREMASAPASWATYAICAIEVTLGESLTMIGRDATRFAVRTTSSSKCGSLRSEEHTSELQSRQYLVCRLLLEKKKKIKIPDVHAVVTGQDQAGVVGRT